MAGFFNEGVCYARQQDAIDTYFQKIQPFVVSSANTGFIVSYHRLPDGAWQTKTQNMWGQNGFITAQPVPVFGSCELPNDPTANFIHGMELGSAVATVCVLVFVIRKMYRGF